MPLTRPPARKFHYISEAFEAYRAFGMCIRVVLVPTSLCRWVCGASPLRVYARYLQHACILHPHLIIHTVYIYVCSSAFLCTPPSCRLRRWYALASLLLPVPHSLRPLTPLHFDELLLPHILLDPSAIPLAPPPVPLTPPHTPLYTPASFHSSLTLTATHALQDPSSRSRGLNRIKTRALDTRMHPT
ncbi:hypothetical protein C8R44DRAFT_896445 [Mycena epipterygia]|nr:hypothetical protein C8R44DRAFT_896445 [Mycena epipterygia]